MWALRCWAPLASSRHLRLHAWRCRARLMRRQTARSIWHVGLVARAAQDMCSSRRCQTRRQPACSCLHTSDDIAQPARPLPPWTLILYASAEARNVTRSSSAGTSHRTGPSNMDTAAMRTALNLMMGLYTSLQIVAIYHLQRLNLSQYELCSPSSLLSTRSDVLPCLS
jgi:hypothetical protein